MNEKKPEVKVSEDGKKITVIGPIGSKADTFEIVDHIPRGYSIWNIGKNMADGYLPLCRLRAVQPFPGGRSIETESLKAIKCEGAQVILSAVGYGPERPEEMERYIKLNEGKRYRKYQVERMKAALPYIRELKWD